MRATKLLIAFGLTSLQVVIACHDTSFNAGPALPEAAAADQVATSSDPSSTIATQTASSGDSMSASMPGDDKQSMTNGGGQTMDKSTDASGMTGTAVTDVGSLSLEFAPSENYRVGDGYSGTDSSSTCVGVSTMATLAGTTFYYEFEVLEDATQIDLSISRLCGIDNTSKDVFRLIENQSKAVVLAEKSLPKLSEADQKSKAWAPYEPFTLNKGTYSVVIEAKNVYGHTKVPGQAPDPTKDEYDDFFVGGINLKSTKNIRKINIYSE